MRRGSDFEVGINDSTSLRSRTLRPAKKVFAKSSVDCTAQEFAARFSKMAALSRSALFAFSGSVSGRAAPRTGEKINCRQRKTLTICCIGKLSIQSDN